MTEAFSVWPKSSLSKQKFLCRSFEMSSHGKSQILLPGFLLVPEIKMNSLSPIIRDEFEISCDCLSQKIYRRISNCFLREEE